ncbi:autotransporter-associated beta strand repeat-containing protein [Luteolibacter ambystomatis]|uniref:Autotransporter-associated beta strand repeat-containing protein n=1 Tax=Luteolibacter ambystomatis TaxID=2824561 RepID=A0A975PH15_9BACT|nr:DUF6288 domain-containing protein [Luteolibacter ambystomatis]QUE52826.1 autotransporter-associated beta strand repeat-containing protein [Luteolibacter ambystomatis]
MRSFSALFGLLSAVLLPSAMAQEETRDYPLGPIGGRYRVTQDLSFIRVSAIDSTAPGAAAGLQVGDYIYGAFGKTFTPTGSYHYGASQDLGFAVDRAEGSGGTLPLKVLRPGTGALDINVTLPSVGRFGPAYPRGSSKHQAMFESACAYLHQRAMNANGSLGYFTGWTGLALLGHPNWNDTTGSKPYRLSINKIRDYCVAQITAGTYAPVEDKLLDGTTNPNYAGSNNLSNWQLGQMVAFLSEYYAKTSDASVASSIQRGAEMCANTIQWWKQPALNANGYSPGYTQIAGMCSHGGVTGDYIHLGWGGGINICGVYSFNGMAFAKRAGMDMTVRPRDGHYFGYTTAPAGAVPAGMENYDHSIDEKFQMQWNWMGKRCAYYSTGSNDDGHVAYTLNAPSSYDAAGRTPGTILGLSQYKVAGGTLTADDEDKLSRLKAYISRNYMRQQEAHAYCVGAQTYQAMATAFLSDRQQRFALDNWRFYYALSRTYSAGFQYFRARSVNDNYLDETHCSALDMAIPYAVANGGYNLLPRYNNTTDQVLADFQSPDITWPTIDARKTSLTGATLAMPVQITDGAGTTLSADSYTAAWSTVSGPGSVTFSAPSAATTNITFGSSGTYRLQLTVTRGSYTLVEPIDVSVRLQPVPAGYIGGIANYQVYTGITGTTVANLTGATKFPNSPDVVRTVTQLTGNYSGDNYGARLSGVIIPPVTGSYRFYIASDDASQLKLNSTGPGAAGATVISTVATYTNANEWTKYTSQQSAAINLTAGQPVYFEALQKEGTGGDHLSVGWSIGGGAISVIDGTSLAVPDTTPATMAISTPPSPTSVALGGTATFTVGTTGPQPGFYQWRRNGSPVGTPTTSPTLTLSNVSGGVEGNYDCVYTTVLGTATSTAARLTVTDAGVITSGGLWREVYSGIDGSTVASLTSAPGYPEFASTSGPITSAATPSDYADSYGQRLTGWIKPTVSGNYRFYLTSDDDSELWLGTNELAANKVRLLQLSGYTNPMAWSARSPSAYVALEAGKRYYIEVLHKEGGGGDHCAVAWQRQGDAAPVNGSGEIPGQYLEYRIGGSYDDIPVGNQVPAFLSNPLVRGSVPETIPYSGESLAGSASDFNSADTLTYSKVSGPAWLTVAANGALSGTPGTGTMGLNQFVVQVTDQGGLSSQATLRITVNAPTRPPVFSGNPIATATAIEAAAYSDTLVPFASDPDGDALTFSKVSGPAWLNVAANGALSGTPGSTDGGANSFTVRVTDSAGASATTTLNISVTTFVHGDGVWTKLTGGSWPTTGNWSGGTAAFGVDQTADFSTLNITANTTVTLDGPRAIGNLKFGDTTASHDWLLNAGSGGPLTLDVSTGTPLVTINNRTATLATALAGSEGFTKAGSGTLALTGTNTLTGPVTITGGTLSIGGNTPGITSVTLNGGVGVTVATGGTLTASGALSTNNSAGANITIQNGGVLNAGSIAIPWNPGTFSVSGALNSTGNLNISTAATTNITGTNGSITAASMTIGNAGTVVNHNASGQITLTGSAILGNSGGSYSNTLTITQGTVNAGGVQLGISGSTATQTVNVNGGRLNVGAGGITSIGTGTRAINLGAGTVGARADWSSTLAMALTGGATINTLDASDNATARTVTLSGVLSGSGSLTKSGAGTLLLSATNTYTGTTTVGGGILTVNGSLSTGVVTVQNGGTLSGTGTVGGASTVQNGGSLAPGSGGIGTLGTAAITLQSGAVLRWDLAATGSSDLVNATSLTFSGTPAVTLKLTGANPVANGGSAVIPLVTTTGGITNFSSAVFTVDTSALSGVTGTWKVIQQGNTLALSIDTGYNTTWRDQKFGAQAGNAAIAGPTADPDGDGVANIVEQYLGLEPLSSLSRLKLDLMSVVSGGNRHFRLSPAVTSGSYQLEMADSPAGPWSATYPVPISNATATYEFDLPSSYGRRFFRLRYTVPTPP